MGLIYSTSIVRPATSTHPQGRKAGRPAGAGADKVRTGDQPQNRQGPRPRPAAHAARASGRGDRMKDLTRRRGDHLTMQAARSPAAPKNHLILVLARPEFSHNRAPIRQDAWK